MNKLWSGIIALAVIVATVGVADADIRYRVRPRFGEMESFGRTPRKFDCDNATRIKFWGALAKQPVITVRQDKTVDIAFNFETGEKIPAARNYKSLRGQIIGFWTSAIPGLTFGVSIEERPTKPPIVEVSLDVDITLPDGSKTICSEKWSGIGDKF